MRLFLAVAFALALAGAAWPGGGIAAPEREARRPTTFVYDQSCLPSGTRVGFAVPGTLDLPSLVGGRVGYVWIDLSLFDNDFAPGTFIGAGPFVPRLGATEFGWEGLEPVQRHYYRLNALTESGWHEVGRGSFETINCGPVRRMGCSIPDGAVSVEFGLGPAGMFGSRAPVASWFDLTLFGSPRNPILDNGFPPGTFVGAGPFPTNAAIFAWNGIKPNARHYYRQNTNYGDGVWEPQFSGSFVSLDCSALPAFQAPH